VVKPVLTVVIPLGESDVTQSLEKTVYQSVQESIRKRIMTGEWPIGSKIPSERELEKDLQISRLTINKGLSNLVSQGLLIRRRGQGTFVLDPKSKSAQARKLIKFISPVGPGEDRNSVRHGILEGMYESLIDQGYHVGIDFYKTPQEQIQRLQQDSDPTHAGFVIWYEPDMDSQKQLIQLQENNFPFVLVDAYPMDFETDFVVTDNTEGGRMVVEYLVNHGHKNIGYISRPVDRSSMRDRQAGFLQGLVNYGLPFSSSSVINVNSVNGNFNQEVCAAVDAFIHANQSITALFFSNDELALVASDYLRSKNIRIPEEISIISFDDIDRSAFCPIPLTTVHQDFFELGKVAADVLLQKLNGKADIRPIQIFSKPRLVERASVGMARK
jgi:DNA-binding LacI/PurR family transcriptional regulator